jgi:hypothetical protein
VVSPSNFTLARVQVAREGMGNGACGTRTQLVSNPPVEFGFAPRRTLRLNFAANPLGGAGFARFCMLAGVHFPESSPARDNVSG